MLHLSARSSHLSATSSCSNVRWCTILLSILAVVLTLSVSAPHYCAKQVCVESMLMVVLVDFLKGGSSAAPPKSHVVMAEWYSAGLHPHSSSTSSVRWIILSYLWVLEVQGTLYLAAQQHLFLLAGLVYLEAPDSLCHLYKWKQTNVNTKASFWGTEPLWPSDRLTGYCTLGSRETRWPRKAIRPRRSREWYSSSRFTLCSCECKDVLSTGTDEIKQGIFT